MKSCLVISSIRHSLKGMIDLQSALIGENMQHTNSEWGLTDGKTRLNPLFA